MNPDYYLIVVIVWIAIGLMVLPATIWVTAPFGRHSSSRFGPTIDNRLGWVVMESPALWWFTLAFVMSVHGGTMVAWLLWSMWMCHYVHRGIIFPFRTKTAGKRIPLIIVVTAFGFQLVNGYLNGLGLGEFGQKYTIDWLWQPVFLIGLLLFGCGVAINVWSDNVLLKLRTGTDRGYKIPRGGLYSRISCPNFLGEMIQWTGWAVMCWNLAALSFAIWTVANLLPRAMAHHRWYREHFDDYPPQRKAVLPGLL